MTTSIQLYRDTVGGWGATLFWDGSTGPLTGTGATPAEACAGLMRAIEAAADAAANQYHEMQLMVADVINTGITAAPATANLEPTAAKTGTLEVVKP